MHGGDALQCNDSSATIPLHAITIHTCKARRETQQAASGGTVARGAASPAA